MPPPPLGTGHLVTHLATTTTTTTTVNPATAVIAIGSNEGDRVDLFRRALRALDEAGIAGTRPSRSNQSHILISRRNLFHHPSPSCPLLVTTH